MGGRVGSNDLKQDILALGSVFATAYTIALNALNEARKKVADHNNEMHQQVNSACGTNLNDDQMWALRRGEAWKKAMAGSRLSALSLLWRLKNEIGQWWGGLVVGTIAGGMAVNKIAEGVGVKEKNVGAAASMGMLFAVGGASKLFFFDPLRTLFAPLPNLYPVHPICREARELAGAKSPSPSVVPLPKARFAEAYGKGARGPEIEPEPGPDWSTAIIMGGGSLLVAPPIIRSPILTGLGEAIGGFFGSVAEVATPPMLLVFPAAPVMDAYYQDKFGSGGRRVRVY